MSRKKKGFSARTILDKVKDLMSATEEDEQDEDLELDTDQAPDQQIDITQKDQVRAVQGPRPVMEEIFSTTSEEIKVKTTNPLDVDTEADSNGHTVPLYEVKLEEPEEIKQPQESKPRLQVITPETIKDFVPPEEKVELTNLDEFLKDAIKDFDEEEDYIPSKPKQEEEIITETSSAPTLPTEQRQRAIQNFATTQADHKKATQVEQPVKKDNSVEKPLPKAELPKSQESTPKNKTDKAVNNTTKQSNGKEQVAKEDKIQAEKQEKKQVEKQYEKQAEKQDKKQQKKQDKPHKTPFAKRFASTLKNAVAIANAKPDELMPDYIYGQETDGVINLESTEDALRFSKEPKINVEKAQPTSIKKKLDTKTKKAEKSKKKKSAPSNKVNKGVEKQAEKPTDKKADKPLDKPMENQAEKPKQAKTPVVANSSTSSPQTAKPKQPPVNLDEETQEKGNDKYLGSFEKQFGEIQPMDKGERLYVNGIAVPAYIPEGQVQHINTLSGRFSVALRSEYEEYLIDKEQPADSDTVIKEMLNNRVDETEEYSENGTQREYKRATATQEEIENKKQADKSAKKPKQPKQATAEKEEIKEPLNLKEKLFGSFEQDTDYSSFTAPIAEDQVNLIADYDSPADAKAVRAEINLKIRRLFAKTIATSIIFVLSLAVVIGQKFFPLILKGYIPNVDIVYCIVSFLMLIISASICHETIKNGLKPLLAFRGNSDTVLAVATIITAVQGITTFFESTQYYGGEKNMYSLLVVFALMLNTIGKLCVMKRVKDNFKFITAPNRKYVAKVYDDEKTASKMVKDLHGEKPVVAFQRRTGFLKNFLRLSYTPDPSETVAAKFAPFCILTAVIIAIIYGIINVSITGAISAMSIVSCVSIPVCCLLAVNIPMKMLCKRTLKSEGMVVGYPAVKQFCKTNAIMIDSKALYPRGRVQLESVRTFLSYKIDESLLSAAAVVKVANTSLTYLFEDIIIDRADSLPSVESVSYEDEKGLVAWVEGERMLLGNRELLKKYGIEPPSLDYEEKYTEGNKRVTYLANSGQLIAMFVINYKVDKRISDTLRQLEKNGVGFLIRTADPNITQENVFHDFKIYYRSIQILPTVFGNICKEQVSEKDTSTRCYIATRGKMLSLARAISGCIKIKRNIGLAIVIQLMAVILGLLIVTAVVIASGLENLGTFELFIYTLIWAVVSIVVPILQKP